MQCRLPADLRSRPTPCGGPGGTEGLRPPLPPNSTSLSSLGTLNRNLDAGKEEIFCDYVVTLFFLISKKVTFFVESCIK